MSPAPFSLDLAAKARRGDFGLDAEVQAAGPVICLFGRSGAGKSTLADVVAGLVRPEAGRIAVAGETLFDRDRGLDIPAWSRRIGYVFQEARLFPHLSVRQNLLFARTSGGRTAVAPALEEVAALLGLEALLDRRPAGLSGGEARRVAIGRALLSNPRLLIMDEPLVGLDGARRAELMPYLEAIARAGTMPILYVTHAVEEVLRLADQVVLMEGGRTLATAPPADIFDLTEAEAAAGLDAPLSVLDGRVAGHEADGSGTRVEIGPARFLAPRLDLQPGERARVVIDARDVALALSDPQDTSVQNRLELRIEAIETRPNGRVVRLAGPGLKLKSLVTAAAVERLGLAPGRTVFALIKATAAARRANLG